MNTSIGISKTYRGTQTQNNDGLLIWSKKPPKNVPLMWLSRAFLLVFCDCILSDMGFNFSTSSQAHLHLTDSFFNTVLDGCYHFIPISLRTQLQGSISPGENCLGTKVIPNLTKSCEPFRVDFQAGEDSYWSAIVYFIYFRGFKCVSL